MTKNELKILYYVSEEMLQEFPEEFSNILYDIYNKTKTNPNAQFITVMEKKTSLTAVLLIECSKKINGEEKWVLKQISQAIDKKVIAEDYD
jgi:disulfide oxidoreductase YuzD